MINRQLVNIFWVNGRHIINTSWGGKSLMLLPTTTFKELRKKVPLKTRQIIKAFLLHYREKNHGTSILFPKGHSRPASTSWPQWKHLQSQFQMTELIPGLSTSSTWMQNGPGAEKTNVKSPRTGDYGANGFLLCFGIFFTVMLWTTPFYRRESGLRGYDHLSQDKQPTGESPCFCRLSRWAGKEYRFRAFFETDKEFNTPRDCTFNTPRDCTL